MEKGKNPIQWFFKSIKYSSYWRYKRKIGGVYSISSKVSLSLITLEKTEWQ